MVIVLHECTVFALKRPILGLPISLRSVLANAHVVEGIGFLLLLRHEMLLQPRNNVATLNQERLYQIRRLDCSDRRSKQVAINVDVPDRAVLG